MTKQAVIGAMALLVAFGSAGARAETIDDLYGLWAGTWYVDEQFDEYGDPVGTPPYEPEPIEVLLYEWNGTAYGEVVFPGCPGWCLEGTVISLGIDQNNVVTMGVLYEEAGSWADAIGTLVGNTITGDYDEEFPALPGWIHWRGPFSVSLVPEPHSLGLFVLCALMFDRRWYKRFR
ncbi:MAG: hypothetical protein ABII12_05230 [Planctomycetota bacterium]